MSDKPAIGSIVQLDNSPPGSWAKKIEIRELQGAVTTVSSPGGAATYVRVECPDCKRLQERLTEARRLLREWALYFESGNAVPVERATILANRTVVGATRAFLAQEDKS